MTKQATTPKNMDIDQIPANRIDIFMIRCIDCGASDRMVMSQAKAPGERAGIRGLVFYCEKCILGNQERKAEIEHNAQKQLAEESKNVDPA